MLYLERLIKNYGGFRAVDGLSLHVPKGDLLVLSGLTARERQLPYVCSADC